MLFTRPFVKISTQQSLFMLLAEEWMWPTVRCNMTGSAKWSNSELLLYMYCYPHCVYIRNKNSPDNLPLTGQPFLWISLWNISELQWRWALHQQHSVLNPSQSDNVSSFQKWKFNEAIFCWQTIMFAFTACNLFFTAEVYMRTAISWPKTKKSQEWAVFTIM